MKKFILYSYDNSLNFNTVGIEVEDYKQLAFILNTKYQRVIPSKLTGNNIKKYINTNKTNIDKIKKLVESLDFLGANLAIQELDFEWKENYFSVSNEDSLLNSEFMIKQIEFLDLEYISDIFKVKYI